MTKKRNRLFLLLIIINGYFIIALVLAIAGKYYFLQPDDTSPDSVVQIVPFSWTEKKTVTPFNTYSVQFNTFGARNTFEVDERDGDIVVLLGDSFFFGYGLNDNETISHFLNENDTTRRYLNLAFSGSNLWDSVDRFVKKQKELPQAPTWIIFQVLFHNDIYPSNIEAKILLYYRFILPPFNLFISKDRFVRSFLGRYEQKVYNDLSPQRFKKYLSEPLNRLKNEISKSATNIIIVCYNDEEKFSDYIERLKRYCHQNSMSFIQVSRLMTPLQYENRLPDGHPTAALNATLARQIIKHINNQ